MIPSLVDCEPVVGQHQGSLFQLTMSEYEAILEEAPVEDEDVPESALVKEVYNIDDALDGLFVGKATFCDWLKQWRTEKNLILQGAPGVGKTFVARRLAYALMQEEDKDRVALVQFHQSYGYEDFVQGIKPMTTIQTLAGAEGLASRQRLDMHTLLRRMDGIGPLHLRKAHFTEVRLHRNNSHYRLLMHVCELVYDNLLVNEQTGQRFFRDFLRDKQQMARLFERFVANFYRKETAWNVTTQEKIPWSTPTPNALLPEMNADAVLRHSGLTLIVECKFYQETLQSGQWSEKPKLRSHHLYQLTSYMDNLRCRFPDDGPLEGVIIYPAVNTCLYENLLLAGNQIRVSTLELNAPWEQVSAQLKKS